MSGRHVGINRCGVARIDHAPLTESCFNNARQPLIDGEVRVDQADETVATAGVHKGRADVSRTFGLVAAAAKVKMDLVSLFFHCNMNTDWTIEVDAIVVDKALSL